MDSLFLKYTRQIFEIAILVPRVDLLVEPLSPDLYRPLRGESNGNHDPNLASLYLFCIVHD